MRGLSLQFRPARRRGYSFVEVLAAMMFVGILLPVVVQAMLVSNRMGAIAQRKRIAVQLANDKLTELVATGEWRYAVSGEEFEDYPGFRWELISEAWSEDQMQVVSVAVTYQVQGREYREVISTLADPNAETRTTTVTSR